jgi:hypothetical protein
VTEEPAIYLMEEDEISKDRGWRRITWDEGIRIKKNSVIVIKMGDAATPFNG